MKYILECPTSFTQNFVHAIFKILCENIVSDGKKHSEENESDGTVINRRKL